jgi:UDP-N-acetylglucosamine--N-acetylmuramyl-(pentapeptide) pyrophosphoryl-undecaprenol N-acetylglucosamine transferase
MIAAVMMGVPTLVYEPNAVPGMTNRVLGKRVSAAAVAYPQTVGYFRGARVTGVPVRREIFRVALRPEGSEPRLLVTAGSNGALVFNQVMPRIVGRLLAAVPGLTVMHQSGPRALEATEAAYAASGADASRWSVRAFLTDMAAEYSAADLVLARAGSTVAELCVAGRASVLVPLPTAADDHQRKNAEVLVEAGAAAMLLQQNVTEELLLEALVGLLKDPSRRAEMGERARALAKPRALEEIGEMIVGLAKRG